MSAPSATTLWLPPVTVAPIKAGLPEGYGQYIIDSDGRYAAAFTTANHGIGAGFGCLTFRPFDEIKSAQITRKSC